MFAALDLLDEIETYQRLVIAIAGVHAAYRPDHIRWCGLDVVRDLRSITPLGLISNR